MRRKTTFRWTGGIKKAPIPVPSPVVDVDYANVRATVQRRSNNLKANADRNSLSSTGSSSNSEEAIVISLMSSNSSKADDTALVEKWLTSLQFEEYIPLFTSAGYDMPTIYRMTPADLTAIGVTKPLHRRKLNLEIEKLNISDGLPDFIPKSLLEWLKLIRLDEYFDILCQQGYDSIDRVIQLTWEDFEEIGIKKLGHQKRLTLAIKRIQDLNNGVRRPSTATFSSLSSSIPSSSSLSSDSSSSSNANVAHASHHNLSLPLKSYPLGEEVAINTSLSAKLVSPTLGSPSTPELKTFQPGSDCGSMPSSCSSSVSKMPIGNENSNDRADTLSCSSLRGQSIESLSKDEADTSKITAYLQHYISRLQKHESRQDFTKPPCEASIRHTHYHQGYESDCEISSPRLGFPTQQHDYETTATLNRPRSLIKARPVAKIVANSRHGDDFSTSKNVTIIPPHVEIKVVGKSLNHPENSNNFYEDVDSINLLPPPPIDDDGNTSPPTAIPSATPSGSNGNELSTKKSKVPPAPPKRVNSVKITNSDGIYASNMRMFQQSSPGGPQQAILNSTLDSIQERSFATCVKSLTAKFHNETYAKFPPLPSRNHITTPKSNVSSQSPVHNSTPKVDDEIFDDENLPPPPPPDEPPEYYSAVNGGYVIDNLQYQRLSDDILPEPQPTFTNGAPSEKSNTVSNSSSTESMPFANDNIGTIKQRDYAANIVSRQNSSPIKSPSSSSQSSSYQSSSNHTPSFSSPTSPHEISSNLSQKVDTPPSPSIIAKSPTTDVSIINRQVQPSHHLIEDIETMLCNLSNQLDELLESETSVDRK